MAYPLWLQLSLLKPPYGTAVMAMIVRCTGASESDSYQKVQEWVGEVVGGALGQQQSLQAKLPAANG